MIIHYSIDYSSAAALMLAIFDALYAAVLLPGFGSSSRNVAARIESADITQKLLMGIGRGNSATIGAPMVMQCATKLTTPKTVATYYVGKSLATET